MPFLLRRLLGLVPTLLGVVIATFLLTRLLPGDPAVFFANSVTAASNPPILPKYRRVFSVAATPKRSATNPAGAITAASL